MGVFDSGVFRYVVLERPPFGGPTGRHGSPLLHESVVGQCVPFVVAGESSGCVVARNESVTLPLLLLVKGADVDAADMMEASIVGHADVVAYLLEKEASADLEASNGVTALMTASAGCHYGPTILMRNRWTLPPWIVTD